MTFQANEVRPGLRPALLGRDAECTALDSMTDALRAGESRVLVVRGPAGAGKSALLEYTRRSAQPDVRVLEAVGMESETELAFAALHQLCAPVLDHLGRLPVPQITALETVFGMRADASPDRFLVGLAVLRLLSEASQERPLLCLVDDAQWLDPASAQVLGFVGRRLLAESIALLLAVREPGRELLGLPELEVPGLNEPDAHALLGSLTHAGLDRGVRDRIVAETQGNPGALLQVSRGLSVTQLAGGFALPDAGAPPGRVESAYRARLPELPAPIRLLLLVAAAEPVGDPGLIWRAAARLGVPAPGDLEDGADSFVSFGDRVTFRRPWARAAVYRAATARERRAVHLALAAVTDEQADPDRRAWHLAAAAGGPDEHVAAELERAEPRARMRGGLAAAAAFRQRALALTQDPGRRVDRALSAAATSLNAGDLRAAQNYLTAADRHPQDDVQAARAELVRGQIALASGRAADAGTLLLAAARRLEPLDPDAARDTYLAAWSAAAVAADDSALLEVSRAITARTVEAVPPPVTARPPSGGDRPEVAVRPAADELLVGLALLGSGPRAAAVPALRRAATALAEGDVLRFGRAAAAVAPAVWDDEAMREVSARQVRAARETGALLELPVYLDAAGLAAAWSGELATATGFAAEATEVALATGARLSSAAALLPVALRGREAEATALIAATVKVGAGVGVTLAYWAAAVLYNGLARYPDALAAARAAAATAGPIAPAWALPELVEAAVRTGEADVARDALTRLADATGDCCTDWARGVSARCHALLGDDAEADRSYREALERLGRTRLRPELARAHLLYGEWLRRRGQRVDARAQLGAAYELFAQIGMEAFADRARRELLATGESVRKRTTEAATNHELTPQQQQIALLVRDGLSNPEVGARLFLSPRTVEWHLRKIFTKLSITSRRQLREVLPRNGETTAG